MDWSSKSTPTRRTLLSGIAGGLAASSVGTVRGTAGTGSHYVLEQGDQCEPIRPIRGDVPVEEFYEYRLPAKYATDRNGATVGDTAKYSSAGTEELQRDRTSISFLYHGPEGLSLIVVHGHVGSSDGGSVTLRLQGLPSDGEWTVKDDLYRNPDTGEQASSNYDRWETDGTEHRVSWTWGSSGTDGGAFRGLGDDFEVTVEPSFNEAAALFGEHYEGTVADWEFLSGSVDDPERISLDLDETVRIRTGDCRQDRGVWTSNENRGQKQEKEQQHEQNPEQQQEAEQHQEQQEQNQEQQYEQNQEQQQEQHQEQQEPEQQSQEQQHEQNQEQPEQNQEQQEEAEQQNQEQQEESEQQNQEQHHEQNQEQQHEQNREQQENAEEQAEKQREKAEEQAEKQREKAEEQREKAEEQAEKQREKAEEQAEKQREKAEEQAEKQREKAEEQADEEDDDDDEDD